MNPPHDSWTPAVIATRGLVLKFHEYDNGRVTCFAGERIRVQQLPAATECQFCAAPYVAVHPHDALRLWGAERICICLNRVVMD